MFFSTGWPCQGHSHSHRGCGLGRWSNAHFCKIRQAVAGRHNADSIRSLLSCCILLMSCISDDATLLTWIYAGGDLLIWGRPESVLIVIINGKDFAGCAGSFHFVVLLILKASCILWWKTSIAIGSSSDIALWPRRTLPALPMQVTCALDVLRIYYLRVWECENFIIAISWSTW
jgi:hypothetical protein